MFCNTGRFDHLWLQQVYCRKFILWSRTIVIDTMDYYPYIFDMFQKIVGVSFPFVNLYVLLLNFSVLGWDSTGLHEMVYTYSENHYNAAIMYKHLFCLHILKIITILPLCTNIFTFNWVSIQSLFKFQGLIKSYYKILDDMRTFSLGSVYGCWACGRRRNINWKNLS